MVVLAKFEKKEKIENSGKIGKLNCVDVRIQYVFSYHKALVFLSFSYFQFEVFCFMQKLFKNKF